MPHLDLGTALLIWILVSTLAHEYSHSFMAKLCGYKTIGFLSFPILVVLLEAPQKQLHSIFIFTGGWIFGVVSIILFLPFIAPEYIVVFLITSLVINTVLFIMADGIMGILSSLLIGVKKTWSEYHKFTFSAHKKMASIGLGKMVIIDRKKYDKLTKEFVSLEHSVAFFDKMDIKGWMVLFSLLTLGSALMVALVNGPVFGTLGWFGVEIEADFSLLFWALVGTTFILTITERLILHYCKK